MKKLIKSILIYAPGSMIPAVVALISTTIFTRLFTTEEYGRYSIVLSVATFVIILFSQWLQQSVNRFFPGINDVNHTRMLKEALVSSLILITLSIVALFCAAFPLLLLYNPLSQWRQVFVIALIFIISNIVFNLINVVFQSEMNAIENTKNNLINSILRLALALLLIYFIEKNSLHIITAFAIACSISIPFMWKKAKLPSLKKSFYALKDTENRDTIKQFFYYGIPMSGWVVSTFFLNSGDRYIIQYFKGSAEVGIYSANQNLINGAIGFASAPILMAAHPFLMKAWNMKDYKGAEKWLTLLISNFFVISAILLSFIILFSKNIVFYFLGEEFRAGHVILPVAILSNAFWQLGMYAHKPLEFVSKTKTMALMVFISVVINLLLNIIFVPIFGYIAAAYSSLAGCVLYFALVCYAGRRIVAWKFNRKLISINLLMIFIYTILIQLLANNAKVSDYQIFIKSIQFVIGVGLVLLFNFKFRKNLKNEF